MLVLPIAQYPPLAPPQIEVSTQYIGASADVVSKTVTTPLEEKINGAGGMIYMASTSTNNGDSSIVVTFEVGFDPNVAQMDVLTRSNRAMAELPEETQKVGVTIKKKSTNMLLAVNLISPKGTYDAQFLQNYADLHITDSLARIPGVAEVMNMALRRYAIRIWLDPEKLSSFGLTAADVRDAIREQNKQVAAGKIGGPPAPAGQAFQYQLTTQGRLSQVSQFENIILKAKPDGSLVRIKDVARVELGAEDYDWDTKLNGQPTATLIVYQLPDANGLKIKKATVKIMERLAKDFPPDMEMDHSLRHHGIHRRIHERGGQNPYRGHYPGGAGGLSLLTELRLRPHSHHSHTCLHRGYLRLHEDFWVLPERPEHAGPGSSRGPGGGRCHRGC